MRFHPVVAAQRLSALRRGGWIDPLTFTVACVLLWECRAKNHDRAQVSLERLAALAGVGLTKTKEAVARLIELGVIAKQKTHQWIDGLRRQGRNIYRFVAAGPEVAARPTVSRQEKKQRRCEERRGRLVRGALASLGRALRGVREQSAAEIEREAVLSRDRQLAILLGQA
jgi:hypothetical protein